MKATTYLFLLLPILLLLSCEDFFDSVTDVDIEPHESKMTLHVMADDLDTENRICVGYSTGTTSEQDPGLLDDAVVEVYKNGTLMNVALIPSNPCATTDQNLFDGQPGDQYEIRASHPDYPSISATQTMPQPPVVLSADYVQVGAEDPLEEVEYDRLNVRIRDNAETQDYYHIEGLLRNKTGEDQKFYSIWSWSDNVVLEYNANSVGLIVDDKTFNGTDYTFQLKLDANDINPQIHDIYVSISHITQDRYLELRSQSLYYDNEDNPFAEPVTVHSNVENGYGIFGLANKEVVLAE